MFLLGNFQHMMEDNRIRFPAKFRKIIGGSYALVPGTSGCIFVYSPQEMEKFMTTLGDIDSANPSRLELVRKLSSKCAWVDTDGQGRFVLPDNLMEFAGIQSDSAVQVVGAFTKAEIWSEERWMAREKGEPIITDEIREMDKLHSDLQQHMKQ